MENQKEKQISQLTNKQTKHLRGLGHKLSPVVLIGKEGISENLLETIISELLNHELIKVKIGSNSNVNKHDAAEIIPEKTKSFLVQFIGKTFLLYKANPKKKKDKRIYLPNI